MDASTQKRKGNSYFRAIWVSVVTLAEGARITWRHLYNAIFQPRRKANGPQTDGYFPSTSTIETLRYPYETIPVPDHGRYKLHNEIDDCIVCDKCAKVCPVNCIDIEPVKAIETFGKTSDGTPKRIYAAKFDIDMAKCCFCGLCTTVCPTECLTMTKDYDFSEFSVANMNYKFSDMSQQEAEEKREAYSIAQQNKLEATTGVKATNEEKEGKDLTQESKPKRAYMPKKVTSVKKKDNGGN